MPHKSPLAPWVFILRNKGKSFPLILVIVLAVLLVAGIVSLMNSIPLSVQTVYGYSRYLTGISARGDAQMVPLLLERLKACPHPLERVIPCRATAFDIQSIAGKWPFLLYGLKPEDADYLTRKLGLRNLEGLLPRQGEPECVISRPVAKNRGLRVGDILLRPDDPDNYSPRPVKVVGIFDSDEWFAYTSYEYLAKFHFPPVDALLVVAPDMKTQREVDKWATEEFKGMRAYVFTYPELERQTKESLQVFYAILNVSFALLLGVVTLMVAMLINIYLTQRAGEFALLQTLGLTRRDLMLRAMSEGVLVVVFGWLAGVGLAYAVLALVNESIMMPRAFLLNPLDPIAYLYTLCVPSAILLAAGATVWLRFMKFDPIAVIERRVV